MSMRCRIEMVVDAVILSSGAIWTDRMFNAGLNKILYQYLLLCDVSLGISRNVGQGWTFCLFIEQMSRSLQKNITSCTALIVMWTTTKFESIEFIHLSIRLILWFKTALWYYFLEEHMLQLKLEM